MKFWGISIGILSILGLVVFFILSNLHAGDALTPKEKQDALTHLLGRAPMLSPQGHTVWLTYAGTSISFMYPSWATLYLADNAQAKKEKNVLDSFHFGLLDMHIEGMVSVVSRPEFTKITDDPAVQLRRQSSDYIKISNTPSSILFSKQNPSETSAFILKNGKVYSLIIGGGLDSDSQMVFTRMYDSLAFF